MDLERFPQGGTQFWNLQSCSENIWNGLLNLEVIHSFFCCDFHCLWWKCHTSYWHCVLVHHHEETFKLIWNSPWELPPDTPMGIQNSSRHPRSNMSGNSPHTHPIPTEHGHLFGHTLVTCRWQIKAQPYSFCSQSFGGDEILVVIVVSIPAEYVINLCELFLLCQNAFAAGPARNNTPFPGSTASASWSSITERSASSTCFSLISVRGRPQHDGPSATIALMACVSP